MNRMAPMPWALNIPARREIRGVVLTIAGRADDNGRLEREMGKLCYELQIQEPSTLRRILLHLEQVGLLTRHSRPGPGAKQVIQLATDVEPRVIAARLEADPYLTAPDGNPRSTALDKARSAALVSANSAQETRAGNPRSAALDSETSAGNPRSAALVEVAHARAGVSNSPGTSYPVELNNTHISVTGGGSKPGGVGGNGTVVRAPADRLPPQVERPTELRPPNDDECDTLRSKYAASFDNGADDVDARIRRAMSHTKRHNWDNTFNYLDNWLASDAEKAARFRPRQPVAAGAPAPGQPQPVSRYARFRNTDNSGMPINHDGTPLESAQ